MTQTNPRTFGYSNDASSKLLPTMTVKPVGSWRAVSQVDQYDRNFDSESAGNAWDHKAQLQQLYTTAEQMNDLQIKIVLIIVVIAVIFITQPIVLMQQDAHREACRQEFKHLEILSQESLDMKAMHLAKKSHEECLATNHLGGPHGMLLGIVWAVIVFCLFESVKRHFRNWSFGPYHACQLQVQLLLAVLSALFTIPQVIVRYLVVVAVEAAILFLAMWANPRMMAKAASPGLVHSVTNHLVRLKTPVKHAECGSETDEEEEHLDNVGQVPLMAAAFILLVMRPLTVVLLAFSDSEKMARLQTCIGFGLLVIGASLVSIAGLGWFQKMDYAAFAEVKAHAILCLAFVLIAPLQRVLCVAIAPAREFGFRASTLILGCEAATVLLILVNPFHNTSAIEIFRVASIQCNSKIAVPFREKLADVFDLRMSLDGLGRCSPEEKSIAAAAVVLYRTLQSHPLWTSKMMYDHDDNGNGDTKIMIPLMPDELTEKEEQLYEAGLLEQRSIWPTVMTDLFTTRVISSSVTLGTILVVLLRHAAPGRGLMHWVSGFNLFTLVWAQLGAGVFLWFISGMLLIGNNAFTGRRLAFLSTLVLCTAATLMAKWELSRFLRPFDPPFTEGVLFLRLEMAFFYRHWLHFFTGVVSLLLLLVALVRLAVGHSHNVYLNSELRALHYTALLLRCRVPRGWPKVNTKVLVRLAGKDSDLLEAQVARDIGDGRFLVQWKGNSETVLRKDIYPMRDDPSHPELTAQDMALKNLLRSLKPKVVLPPLLVLAAALGVLATTLFSCTASMTNGWLYWKSKQVLDLAQYTRAYALTGADCWTTGHKLGDVLDFDASGRLVLEEFFRLDSGQQFHVPMDVVPKVLCAVEHQRNQLVDLWANMKAGNVTGDELRSCADVLVFQILNDTLGTDFVVTLLKEDAESSMGINSTSITAQVAGSAAAAERFIGKRLGVLNNMADIPLLGWGLKHYVASQLNTDNPDSDGDGVEDDFSVQIVETGVKVALSHIFHTKTPRAGDNLTVTRTDIIATALNDIMTYVPKSMIKKGENTTLVQIASRITMFWLDFMGGALPQDSVWGFHIGVGITNVASCIFVLYLCTRVFNKYHQLMSDMQSGKIDPTLRGKLRNSFSWSTYLPGVFAFTLALAWLICFTILTSVVGGIVVFVLLVRMRWPLQMLMEKTWPQTSYVICYISICTLIKVVIIDRFCVSGGDIVRPRLFSVCWNVLIVFNFVVGLGVSVFRFVMNMCYALLGSMFLDFTILREELMYWDPGYYALMAATYTWYESANPIRKTFVTAISPSVQRLYSRVEGAEDDRLRSKAWLRARTRFHLALTLHRNPSLRHLRAGALVHEGSTSGSESEE